MDERDPLECVGATIEARERAHRDGTITHFVVSLLRVDGERVPICVATTDDVIELVFGIAPARIIIRDCDSEARAALLLAFAHADFDDQQTPRTLH